MNGGLGRPSVGGRLAAGGGSLQAGCLSDHGFGRSESVSYSRSCVRAVHPRWLVPCVARASRFKLAEQGVRVSRGPAEYRSAEARAGLGAGGYSRAEWRWPASAARMQRCSTSRHLTPPSSGRSKGRSAPFGPPLMSNVRFREVQIPLPVSQASGCRASQVEARLGCSSGLSFVVITVEVTGKSIRSREAACSSVNRCGAARPSAGCSPVRSSDGCAVRVRAGLSVRWRSAHQLVWRANGKTLRSGRAVGGASSGHG